MSIRKFFLVSLWRIFFKRMDMRNHRKNIIFDHAIAWTGRFNMMNPQCFKQKKMAKAMGRCEGAPT